MHCAPHSKNKPYTCFSDKALVKIAKKINEETQDKIDLYNIKDTKVLHNEIKKKLSHTCKTEWCWIEQDFIYNIRNDKDFDVFKPERPKGKKEWLSTIDIDDVLNQYVKLYPDFYYYGALPIDFQEINMELSKIKLKSHINDGIYKIGIVFNHDKHNEPGSHWVAMFIDIDNESIEYFDSAADPPPIEIKRFMKLCKDQEKECGCKFTLRVNKKQHQYKDTECGVYSLNFIIQRLKGHSFKQIVNNVIRDERMNKKRSIYFRPHD